MKYYILALLFFLSIHSAIIQPSTTNTANNVSKADKNYENLTLDQLSDLINKMLSQLNSSSHKNSIKDTQQSANVTKVQDLIRSNDRSKNTSQQTNSTESSQADNSAQNTNLQNQENQNSQSNNLTSQVNTTLQSNNQNQQDSNIIQNGEQKKQEDQNYSKQTLNITDTTNSSVSIDSNTQQLDKNRLSNNSTSNSETVKAILNGNYFNYFVDLNAQNSGNLFLNTNSSQSQQTTPISEDKNQTSNNDTQAKQDVKTTESGNIKSLASTNNDKSSTISSQNQKSTNNSSTTKNNQPILPPSKNNSKSNGNQVKMYPQSNSNSKSTDTKSSSQNKNTSNTDSANDPTKTLQERANLCSSNSECQLAYAPLIGGAFALACRGGVCVPLF